LEITLIDKMGTDLTVVNAARVSFSKESKWDDDGETDYSSVGHAPFSEKDQKLIKYLAKHNHWTPFSHVQITMREKVPIFVARQRFKHMVGFTYNEVSRRYVSDAPEFYVPDAWRGAPKNAKQGSNDEVITNLEWTVDNPYQPIATREVKKTYLEFLEHAEWLYNTMIESGVAPEQARMVLPQSMYTEYYVTGSLSAWSRAYLLRKDSHAQKEIQDLARMWNDTIGDIKELEHSWKALTE